MAAAIDIPRDNAIRLLKLDGGTSAAGGEA
jgi:hypothetical protein